MCDKIQCLCDMWKSLGAAAVACTDELDSIILCM